MLTIKKKLAPTWFTLEGQPEPAPEFLLAPLTSAGRLDARNEVNQRADGQWAISGRGAINAARECIRDWRNVADEQGEQIEFKRELVGDLPPNILSELAGEILARSALSETERKNSSSPST